MSLDTEIGIVPGDIVLDGDPALPHGKGHSSPPPIFGLCRFGPCLFWRNGRPSHLLLGSCKIVSMSSARLFLPLAIRNVHITW